MNDAGRKPREDGYPAGHPMSYVPKDSVRTATASWPDDVGNHKEYSEIEESVAVHVVPRKSLTTKQGLRHFPIQMETEPMKGSHPIMDGKPNPNSSVTNERLVWKSDTTLLSRARPERPIHESRIVRQTSRTGRITTPDRSNFPLDDGISVDVEDYSTGLTLTATPHIPVDPTYYTGNCKVHGKVAVDSRQFTCPVCKKPVTVERPTR